LDSVGDWEVAAPSWGLVRSARFTPGRPVASRWRRLVTSPTRRTFRFCYEFESAGHGRLRLVVRRCCLSITHVFSRVYGQRKLGCDSLGGATFQSPCVAERRPKDGAPRVCSSRRLESRRSQGAISIDVQTPNKDVGNVEAAAPHSPKRQRDASLSSIS